LCYEGHDIILVKKNKDNQKMLAFVILFIFTSPLLYILINNYLFIRGKKLPPGPRGLPVVGYIPWLSFEPYKDFIEVGKQYGGLFSVQLGTRLAIVLNDYKTIKTAFAKHELCGRPPTFPFTYISKGNYGITGANDDMWWLQRRFIVRNMKELGVGSQKMEQMTLEYISNTCKHFEEVAKHGKPYDIAHSISMASVNALCVIVTGNQALGDEKIARMVDHSGRALSNFLFWGVIGIQFPWIFNYVIPHELMASESYKILKKDVMDYTLETIEEHKRTFNPSNLRDFIDYYIQEMKDLEERGELKNSTFSEWQLIIAVTDLIFGGMETTSSSIKWAFLFLASYMDVQEKVQDEIDRVVGKERWVVMSDKPQLPYTEAMMHEAMRLAAQGPFGIVHVANADSVVNGYDIPKGSLILPNLYKCNRDPDVWKYPKEFYPEHYINEAGKFDQTKVFVSFSSGRRNCIGEPIGRMNMFLFLANFLKKFKFSLPNGVKIPFVSPPGCKAIRGPPNYELMIEVRN